MGGGVCGVWSVCLCVYVWSVEWMCWLVEEGVCAEETLHVLHHVLHHVSQWYIHRQIHMHLITNNITHTTSYVPVVHAC